jgi:hypothetical protein
MSCPMKYLKQPSPKPMVAVQMAIIGPPKSGKTTCEYWITFSTYLTAFTDSYQYSIQIDVSDTYLYRVFLFIVCQTAVSQLYIKFSRLKILVCNSWFLCLVANRFVAEYGVVRLSIGEVIRRLLTTQPNTDLVRQINHHLRTGCTVPDDLAVQALDVVLMDPLCQTRGWVE